MNLSEKKILVTGGSSGIGKAIAGVLVQAGATVLTTGRSLERLQAAAAQTGALVAEADIATDASAEAKLLKTCL